MFANRARRFTAVAAAIGAAAWIGLVPPLTASAAPAPPAGLPDLVIVHTSANSATAGQNFTYSVKISNTGAPTPATTQIVVVGGLTTGFQILKMSGSAGMNCQFDNEVVLTLGKPAPIWVCTISRPLMTGDIVSVTATVKAPTVPGRYGIGAFADYTYAVSETNEANNDSPLTFQVQ